MDQSPLSARLQDVFSRLANWSANAMGSPVAFAVSTFAVIVWAASGPLFGFSDTWQLVVNTGTTVLTFLAVFLIQHSQNRDGLAIQLKLDELIRSTSRARNELIDLEACTDDEIEAIHRQLSALRKPRMSKDGAQVSAPAGEIADKAPHAARPSKVSV